MICAIWLPNLGLLALLTKMEGTLYRYYRSMRDKRIIISFHGAVSQQLIIDFGKLLSGRVEPDAPMRARLMSVFVELTENIQRYSLEKDTVEGVERGVGIILAQVGDKGLEIQAGNLAIPADALILQKKINELAEVPKEELRARYRQMRRENKLTDDGGAGLGLIEIARRVDGPVKCDIETLDDAQSFITLHALLPYRQEEA